MPKDTVSVIMPVYNGEKFLRTAAESVLNQTYANLELILIDDGSTDDSKNIMESLTFDKRVRTLYMPKNSGAATARNKGILEAMGRYIAFLDTDDYWRPEKLYRQIEWMQLHKLPLSATAYDWITEDGLAANRRIEVPEIITYQQLLRHNTIGCLTAVYDRSICGTCYMPDIRQRHDWGLWLSITRQYGAGGGLNEVLASYRVRKDSLSANKMHSAGYNWTILREYEKLSLPLAVAYYSQFLLFKGLKYLGWTKY